MTGLNCKELTRRLASDETVGLHWRDRMRVGLHLLLCDKCRRYKLQLEAMGKAAKDLWSKPDDVVALRRLEKEILKKNEDRV